jgi:hypothetical protein
MLLFIELAKTIKLVVNRMIRTVKVFFGSDYMKIFDATKANHNWARFKVNILRMRVRL